MWIFGYGSLTWKADFQYDKKLNGYILGYNRRFYQHSVDHRGVPENPGRVVTLVAGGQYDRVWGVAYYIAPNIEEEVTAHLDYREKDGYLKQTVRFFPQSPPDIEPFHVTLYIAMETNPCYAGPADISTIAAQILRSKGPSGKNVEYLYNLAETMRTIAPGESDEHLFSLEKAVKELEKNSECK